ncbi:MAG: PT domain-containing protein [Thermomicrobiales bacterium]|nr:PT domain-containing protein [Thermomicrobiales bacterium]
MNGPARHRLRVGGALRLLVAAFAVLAMLPALAGQEARAAGSATITVNSFLDDGTTPLPFVRYQVTDSNGTIYGPLETAPPSGSVTFTVDTVDDETTFEIVAETPPACGIAPDPVEVGPLAEGEASSVDSDISFLDNCDLGSISIYSFSCPDGIDPDATDYAVFRDGCTTTVDGKSYGVAEDGGGQQWNVVTGAYGITGRAPLVGLNPGAYLLSDPDPAEETETVVFCLVYPGIPTGSADPDMVFQADTSGENGVPIDLDGERIACDFFAVPASDDEPTEEPTDEPTEEPTDEPTEEPTEEPTPDDGDLGAVDTGTAGLEVHLSVCEPGYDGGDWFGDCHGNGIPDRTITVEGPDGFYDEMQTIVFSSPGPGVAAFSDLDAGEYKVSEDIPGDTATYFAYCSFADSDTVVDFIYDDSTSEAIVLEIGEGEQIVCDFYIVPEDQQGGDDNGKITITKYTCPAGYESDAYGDLSGDCTDKTDGVTFTVSPQSGGDAVSRVTGETSGPGRVRFTELEPDIYDVWEDVPGEFSTAVVWCNVAGGDWYQKQIYNGNATAFDVEAGDDIRCSWFNLPEDLSASSSLRIHKSICPDGLTSGYYANCYDDTLAGVTFVADGPGGYEESLTTGNNGVVTFSDISAGTYTVTELPPDSVNVAVYVIVCTRDGDTYPFEYDDSTGLRMNIKVPAGSDIVCDWYNVPPAKPQPGASGSITVNKFLCQGRSDNKYDWEEDCESYGAGASFELKRVSNGAIVEGTTPSSGKLVFANLANGAYALDETSGDWCHAEADHVDANGNVRVIDGGNTDVYIYNCSKQVTSLPSTGTGPAGSPLSGGTLMSVWGIAGLAGIVFLRRIRRPMPAYARVRRSA